MSSLCHVVYVIVLYTYLSPVHSHAWNGSHFLCHGRNRCYDDQLHCDASKACVIDCHGDNACQYAVIHCPTGASCDVTCGGGIDSCKDVVFLAKHSTSLTISCDRTYEEAFDRTLIYCPDNGAAGPIACHISGISEVNVATKMEIFAVEGLNDVEISGTYVTLASLYCKTDYSSPCTLINSAPFNRCASSDKTCEHYTKPTPSPTQEPTAPTKPPTTAPTIRTTSLPTTDPTVIPTLHPTSDPTAVTTLHPTSDPTVTSTALPTFDPSPVVTKLLPAYDPSDEENTPTPTVSTKPTSSPTKEPTFTPTGRPRNLEYTPRPTRSNNAYNAPTSSPTQRPTARPTRKTLWGVLSHTTTTSMADIALNVVEDDDINDTEYEEEDTKEADLKPLYYVIAALFLSICYVSVSLFCWVHYNQKYTNKVMEIKERNSRSQIARPEKRPLPPIPPLPPHSPKTALMQCEMMRRNHLRVEQGNRRNRPRFNTASVRSSAAPTTDHAPTSRGRRTTASDWDDDDDDDDGGDGHVSKEVNYETNAGIMAEEREEMIVKDEYGDGQRTLVPEAPVIIDDDDDEYEEEEEFKEVDYETSIGGEHMKNKSQVMDVKQMFSSSISSSNRPPLPKSLYSMGIPMSSVSASQAYGYNPYRIQQQQWPAPPPPGQ